MIVSSSGGAEWRLSFCWVSCLLQRKGFRTFTVFECLVWKSLLHIHIFHAECNPISTQKQLICTFTFMAIQQSHINTETFFLHFYFQIYGNLTKTYQHKKSFFALSLSHLWQSHFRRLWWLATWSTAASRESWTRSGLGTNHGSSNMSKDSLRQVHMYVAWCWSPVV